MRFLRGGGIAGFVIRRVLLGLLVMLLVSIIVFVSTQLLGDPARAILGRDAIGAIHVLGPLAGVAFLALSLAVFRLGVRHHASTGT